jgi:hypothetical protein
MGKKDVHRKERNIMLYVNSFTVFILLDYYTIPADTFMCLSYHRYGIYVSNRYTNARKAADSSVYLSVIYLFIYLMKIIKS